MLPADAFIDDIDAGSQQQAGSSCSRPRLAGPMALSSNWPGNWKPWSGLSDLISMAPLSGRRATNPRVFINVKDGTGGLLRCSSGAPAGQPNAS
jgi:hypothetical protein